MAHRRNEFGDPGFPEGIQLCVKYIPLEFEEDFLIEIFSAYGDVLDFHIPEKAYVRRTDYLFGYVTYASKSHAMSAILALNGTPPHYFSVEWSKLSIELRRQQIGSSGCFVEHPPNFRRHSSMGVNYTLTSSPDGKRTIEVVAGGEPRRSVPFGGTSHEVAGNPFEEEDIPAPGQKQKFPCYKCGNLTFRRCVCGCAYYCKEACRINDWPEHKQECIKKLESRPEFKGETSAGSQDRNASGIDLANNHRKTENINNVTGQKENDVLSEQKVNSGNSLGQRQRRFPALNDFDGPQSENFGAKNDGNKQPKFLVRNEVGGLQSERYVNRKESSHNQIFNNSGLKNDHWDYDSEQSKVKKNGNQGDYNESKGVACENQTKRFDGTDARFDMWKRRNETFGRNAGNNDSSVQGDGDNSRKVCSHVGDKSNYIQRDGGDADKFNHREGKNGRNFNDQEGENRKKFSQSDRENRMNFSHQDGENRRNLYQRDVENRRNFNQRDVENRWNINQRDGENRRNCNQWDGEIRRNCNQRDGENRRNCNQRDGENRRNCNQRDGENQRNFSQRDGGAERNFKQRDVENQRNFKQRDGDTGRNINQRDGENQSQQSGGNRRNFNHWDGNTKNMGQRGGDMTKFGDKGGSRKNFGSYDHKSSSDGMNERRLDWTPRNSKEVLQTKCGKIEESQDQQTEVKIEVKQNIPQVELKRKQDAFAAEVDKTTFSAVHTSVEVPAKVEEVLVVMKEGPKTFFVQKMANNDTLELICEKVSECPTLPVVKPEVGMLCGAMFMEEWYRARVLMLAPQLVVQYIDYGNTDICDPATLHALPESIVNYPPMAEEIEILDEMPESDSLLDTIISVKWTGETESGVKKFRIDNGESEVVLAQAPSITPQADATVEVVQQISAVSFQVEGAPLVTKESPPVNAFPDDSLSSTTVPPVVSTVPPVVSTVPPVASTVTPVASTVTPVASTVTPVASTVTPVASTVPPVASTVPPVASTVPPVASTVPPVASTVPPVASTPPPVASTAPPVASTVPPVASTVPPVASTVPAESKLSDAVKVVVIMSERPKIYFVHHIANNDTLKKICAEVVKSPFLPEVKPKVGMLCAAMFEGEWYRARVLMLAPQLIVQYIDYGNIDICDPATLHALPDCIVDYSPMAEKVEFVNETSVLPNGSVVLMKPTGKMENGVLKVMLDDGKNVACPKQVYSAISSQADSTANSQQTSSASLEAEGSQNLSMASEVINSKQVVSTPVVASQMESRPTVASRLQAQCLSSSVNEFRKEFAKAKITVWNDRNDYWVTWERDLEMVEKITLKTHEHISSTPLTNPRVALLCAARYEGIWFRAQITKVLPEVEVLFIDYGNSEVFPVDDLRDLPEPVKDFPSMAFRVKLAEGTPQEYLDLRQDDYLSLRLVGKGGAEVYTAQVEGVNYPSVAGAETQPATVNMVVSPAMNENKTDVLIEANKQVEETSVNSSDPALPSDSAANVPMSKINAPKFYDVKVAFGLGGNEYWVQRVDRDNQLQFVLVAVNDHASKCIRMTPEVGKLCATQFQSFWYRARITKVTPKVEVHFIDYGNTEVCEGDFLELPESVTGIPALALRIRLADGTPAKFSNLPVDSVISVKPVMKAADNVSIVYVEGVHYEADTISQTSQNTCLKFLTAEKNNGGALHFMKKYSDHYYTVTVVTDASRSIYDKLIELRRSGPKLPLDSSFKPVVEDVVLALSTSQGGLCRARVVSRSGNSYRVVLVDCGIVEDVTIIWKLPPSVAYLPAFAVKCYITGYVSEAEFLSKCAKNEDAFIFQVISVENDQVKCLVLSITNTALCTVVLSVWEPGLQEIGIVHVALQDDDPVRMSLYSGPEKVFITSLVPEHVQQFATFSETLHAYCNQAGYLQEPPQIGEILACKFIVDNKFYRCQVQSVSGKCCNVFYIDYGNSVHEVMYDKLKYISEELKKFPCQCLQICLKGVGSSKMTFKLTEFIRKIIDESIILKMKIHTDGVILYTENGMSVNEEIVNILGSKTMMAPMGAVSSDSSGRIKSFGNANEQSLSELPSTALKSSAEENGLPHLEAADLSKRILSAALKHRECPPGELQIFVYFILKDLSFMACPCDPAAVKAVENLTDSLNAHCSGLPTESYYPQVDEVCIAKRHVDGQWYRAVCLIANPSTITRKMMFVDYGYVEDVDVGCIRKMEPKFMELPVLVEKFNIKGVDTGNKHVEKIVREIIVADKLYTAKIIKRLSTHYMVEIPLVTAALQAEGIFV